MPRQRTPREFVRAWQQSSSVAEVAEKVRASLNACRVRAYRYRLRGVPLKKLPPSPTWEDLANYAKEVLPNRRR